MQRNRPKTSVTWHGFTFVPITARKRQAKAAIHNGRIFILCPDNKIAVDSESLFKYGEPREPKLFAEAIFKFGLVDLGGYNELLEIVKKQEEKNWRSRCIRDLKDSIEETGIETSTAQDKAIREFYPEWKFKP